MAEAILRHELAARGCEGVEVASAGTWAYEGTEATSEAVSVLRERGIDLAGPRSRPLQAEDVAAADVVVAMTSVHAREILALTPEVGNRLVMMKEIPEMDVPVPWPNASAEDMLDALLSARRPKRRRALDVDDPMGLPRSAYERCVRDLRQGIDRLVGLLCTDGRSGSR